MAQSAAEQAEKSKPAPPAVTVRKKKLTAAPAANGVRLMEVELEYPQVILTGNMSLTVEINRHFTSLSQSRYRQAMSGCYAEAVKNYGECKKEHRPFIPSLVSMRYEVTCGGPDFLSIVTDWQYETAAGAGSLERQAATWKLPSGDFLLFSDFFAASGYVGPLFSGLVKQIEDRIAERDTRNQEMFLPDCMKGVFLHFDNRNFCLTGQGFNFFYPQGSIAKPEAGIIAVPLPYSDFNEYYAKDMRPE